MQRVINLLRAQAWERAKGELNSIRYSFYASEDGNKAYEEFAKKLADFIKDIENNSSWL